MENASKALIIAGGVLIALLIIGALLLMINQIGDYEKTQSSSDKIKQVTDFNKQFARYTYDDIQGYELISLINKVEDFNGRSGTIRESENSVDYNKKIIVDIDLTSNFKNKYGVEGSMSLFNKQKYTVSTNDKVFVNIIKEFTELETEYSLEAMSKLSANYDSIKTYEDMKKQGKEEDDIKRAGGKSIEEVLGRTNNKNITTDKIAKYREYSDFKRATFKSNGDIVYDGNQVSKFSFIFVK